MTTAIAVALMALAVASWPITAHAPICRREAELTVGGARRWLGELRGRSLGHRQRAGIAAVVVIGLVVVVPIHAALSGALLAYVLLSAFEQSRSRKAALVADARTSDLLHALAAELRAGHDIASACRSVAATDQTSLGVAIGRAGQAIRMGEHPADALLRATGSRAGIELAGVVRLSGSHGIALADAVDVLATDTTDRARERRDLAGLLAGPRATASLLAILPLFGVVMGESIGAHPLQTLLYTGAGAVVMVVGVLLAALGMVWTGALVRRAES